MTSLFQVRARLDEPVLLSSGGEERNRVSTLPFITGSALRGALAARWLRANGHIRPGQPPAPIRPASVREEFLRVFESGAVRFPYLYPDGTTVVALTRHECKARPSNHPQVDLADPRNRTATRIACAEPGCGADLERVRPEKPRHAVRTRTAVGDAGQAAVGYLYAQEELDDGQGFTGIMSVADGAEAGLGDWLPLSGAPEVHLGGDRSTGGRTTLTIRPVRLEPPPLAARHAEWRDAGLPLDTVVLTARSPVVLTDRWLRPAAQFTAEALTFGLGLPGVTVAPGTVGRARLAGGWNPAAGLPKPADMALVEGSVVVFRVPSIDDRVLDRLAAIEADGVGWRRAEGFGSVTVWDLDHLSAGGGT